MPNQCLVLHMLLKPEINLSSIETPVWEIICELPLVFGFGCFFFWRIPQITKQKFNHPLNFLLELVFHLKIFYRNYRDLNSTKIQPCPLLLAIKHVHSSILSASVDWVNSALRSCAGWLDSPVTLWSWCTWNDAVANREVCYKTHKTFSYHRLFFYIQFSPISLAVVFPSLNIQRHTEHQRLINCDNDFH